MSRDYYRRLLSERGRNPEFDDAQNMLSRHAGGFGKGMRDSVGPKVTDPAQLNQEQLDVLASDGYVKTGGAGDRRYAPYSPKQSGQNFIDVFNMGFENGQALIDKYYPGWRRRVEDEMIFADNMAAGQDMTKYLAEQEMTNLRAAPYRISGFGSALGSFLN